MENSAQQKPTSSEPQPEQPSGEQTPKQPEHTPETVEPEKASQSAETPPPTKETSPSSGEPPSGDTPPGDTPPPSVPTVQPEKSHHAITYLIALIALILGVTLGFFLFKSFPQENKKSIAKEETTEITLPADAVQIQECANHKGTLYVQPKDIPVGPIYMVNKGKVIGIEFMLAKDEFLSGKSYTDLSGLGMKVNHVNIGLLSQGHEGYTIPHYHVDFYTVSKEVEQKIVCPATPSHNTASPSAAVTVPMETTAMPTLNTITPTTISTSPAQLR